MVMELLNNQPRGLTIQDISDIVGLSRITVNLILAELKGEGLIEVREVGQSKIHYVKKSLDGL